MVALDTPGYISLLYTILLLWLLYAGLCSVIVLQKMLIGLVVPGGPGNGCFLKEQLVQNIPSQQILL